MVYFCSDLRCNQQQLEPSCLGLLVIDELCATVLEQTIKKGKVKEGTTNVTWLVMSNGPSDFGEGLIWMS